MPRQTKRSAGRINKSAIWDQFAESEGSTSFDCIYSAADPSDQCPACGTLTVINDEGFPTCPSPCCGIVCKDVLDTSAEWRFHGDESSCGDQTRCGMPVNPLLHESSYGCRVLASSSGAKSSWQMRKVRRYTEWQSMPYREKSHYDDFQRIQVHAQNGGIPKVIVDDALRYHSRISRCRTFRGLNRDGIIAASVYLAARSNGFPRSTKEIATIFNLDNSSATRGCKNAMTILNELENDMALNEKTVLGETVPVDFIDRYSSRVGLSDELTKLARFIATRITQLAQFAGIEISKKEVHHVSDISEVTINKCYRKLVDMQDKLVPPAIKSRYPGF